MPPISPPHLIILADLLADLGNQIVQLTLLDLLIFKSDAILPNLLLMSLMDQTPAILLSPLGGHWIDRIGQKRALGTVNAVKCCLAIVLIFNVSRGIVFPAYFCLVTCSLFFHIGRLSMTPLLIPPNNLISFNSLNERVSLVGRILGPSVIGAIIVKTDRGVALGLGGSLFMLSAWAVSALPRVGRATGRLTRTPKKREDPSSLLLHCLQPFRDNSNLQAFFVVLGFVLLGGGVMHLGLPVFFKTTLGGTIAEWGLVLSGFQTGSCLATFVLPPCSLAFRRQTILAATFLVLGGTMAFLGQLTTTFQTALVMIPFGCGFTLMHLFLESLIQANSLKTNLGKTMSLLSAFKGTCNMGTLFASALILKLWGTQSLLLTGAFVMVSASFLARRQ